VIAAVASMHWLTWVVLFCGLSSLCHRLARAALVTSRAAATYAAPSFWFPIACLLIVLHVTVSP
jgi:hypothetical protein